MTSYASLISVTQTELFEKCIGHLTIYIFANSSEYHIIANRDSAHVDEN